MQSHYNPGWQSPCRLAGLTVKLETDRLEIVAEDLKLARAAVEGREALAEQLKATVPAEWPPEVMADAVGYWIPHLEKNSDLPGWAAWYIIRMKDRTVIGGAGFYGLPKDGQLEIRLCNP